MLPLGHPPMLRRLLNIASIVCLVLCVALMGMWVRSFWRTDIVMLSTPSHSCRLASALGQVRCEGLNGVPPAVVARSWKTWSISAEERKLFFPRSFLGFHVDLNAGKLGFAVPYWLPVLLTGTSAAIPWTRRRCRFTLRSLFATNTSLLPAFVPPRLPLVLPEI
jgi:hypothetical protein